MPFSKVTKLSMFWVFFLLGQQVSAKQAGIWSYIDGDINCVSIQNSTCFLSVDKSVDYSKIVRAVNKYICNEDDEPCVEVLVVKPDDNLDVLVVSSTFYYVLGSGVSPSGTFHFQVLRPDAGGNLLVVKSHTDFFGEAVFKSRHTKVGKFASVKDWEYFLENGANAIRDKKTISVEDDFIEAKGKDTGELF